MSLSVEDCPDSSVLAKDDGDRGNYRECILKDRHGNEIDPCTVRKDPAMHASFEYVHLKIWYPGD